MRFVTRQSRSLMMSDRNETAFSDMCTTQIVERVLALSHKESPGELTELWGLVTALHRRAEERVFEAARTWCVRGGPSQRALGADVLGQLGRTEESPAGDFGHRALPVLATLLSDSEAKVLESAITALGHLASREITWEPERLCSLAAHPDPKVRKAVAFALAGNQCDASSFAVAIMLDLMRDEDPDVRNWATFGVASSEADSTRVRDAFLERIHDEDEDVCGEALVGLARRRDRRVFPFIVSQLSLDEVSPLAIDAAAELASPEFIPLLESLLAANPDAAGIAEAIRVCRCSVANPAGC